MTKQDLIRQISARIGSNPLTSRLIIESFFEVIQASLTGGDPVYIRTFGSFILKQRASKVGRHISQNRAVKIAAHVVPYFKPSSAFSDQVRAQSVLTDSETGEPLAVSLLPTLSQ